MIFLNLLHKPVPIHENTRGSECGSGGFINHMTYQQEASCVLHLWEEKLPDCSENMLRRNTILLAGITFQLSVHSEGMRPYVGNEDVTVTQAKEGSLYDRHQHQRLEWRFHDHSLPLGSLLKRSRYLNLII